ncbi:MAG TPA: DUF58 domain-containing protein [Chloroflexota bacterium]|nr:DUF58 domain-containing protein [Chloroflexota bacterium]
MRLTSVSRNSFGEGRRALVARAAALLRPSLGLRAAAAPRSLADDEAFLRRLERLALALQRPPTAGLAGDHRSRRKNDAPEFADYRTYSPGDDFRRIDWKAYGRLGALYYRLGEAQEDLALHLLVDTSASMDYGTPNKLHYARQLAAALGYLALARLDAVGVGALAPRTPPLPLLRGKAQASRLFAYLDGLAATADTAGRPPASLLESVRAYRRGAARGVVVLLSDGFFPDEHAAGLGELLQAGFQPVFLHLLSPQELAPDMAGDLELVDLETGEPVPASLTPEILARYRERLEQWCDELERYCAARRVPYVRLSTALTLEEAVLGELRRRGLLE